MMFFPNRTPNYDKYPEIKIKGHFGAAWPNYEAFLPMLRQKLNLQASNKQVLVIDCYHGVRLDEIEKGLLGPLSPSVIIRSDDAKLPENIIGKKLERNITDDRVFGVLSTHKLTEFFDLGRLDDLRSQAAAGHGLVAIIGVGASLVAKGDILIYADMPRWELQQRFRKKELDNWGAGNFDEDILRKYKRGYFIEWRVFDRHKRDIYADVDFFLDTTLQDTGKAVTGAALRDGIRQAAHQPFRLLPYFDAGIWGGKWMEEVCGLPPGKHNMAWCFDGVPEENAVRLQIDGISIEIPSINIVHQQPEQLLGQKVYARFGAEFPIRFDFLDTMNGGHLSLQVHPTTGYIQENFGMHYTQEESYYILDAGEDACVYLGFKDGIDPKEFINDLREAQKKGGFFDDTKYINCIPIKKHDHLLIPQGTVHCSGANSMVLEISSTPYIFTFKLWDWGRVGLDGIPRPVHVEHGKNVVQYSQTTDWVMENLVNNVKHVAEGDGWTEESTGLHETQFIETRRHRFKEPVMHYTGGSVNVLNLVEGEEAVVESPTGTFEPFVVHFAETFILPAAVGSYVIKPHGKSIGQEIVTIKASVRI